MTQPRLVFDPTNKTFEIDGITYKERRATFKKIDGQGHIDKVIFEPVDMCEIEEQSRFVSDKLKEGISKERIVEEIIKGMNMSQIAKLYKLLKGGAKVKRQDGCLGILVDGGKRKKAYIQIFD
jgi:hypothetical protein